MTNLDFNNFNFRGGFAMGRTKRKAIAENLSFIHGPEPSIFATLSTSENVFTLALIPGFGYVLGFQYEISPKFCITLETIPALSTALKFDNDGLSDNFSINAGFDSGAVAIGLLYRFEKS